MKIVTALALSVLVPLLGFAGAGQAQPSAIQVQGIVQAVDCQAQTVTLSAPDGTNTINAADYTAVLVNSTSVPFCGLQGYVGTPATAWLIANGDQFLATQIDVTAPVAEVPAPAPAAVIAPVPIEGTVLGTVVAAGLVYLLVHAPDGDYYRYPYYGEYYRHYYRLEYRPYTEYYPVSAPIITVASIITGLVLGIVVVDSLQYILTRDDDGHTYRYPYYGPYHQYYYRPSYQPYRGSYQDARVRQGDPHWDSTANVVSRMYHPPVTHAAPQPTPLLQRPIPQQQPIHEVQPPVSQRQPRPVPQVDSPRRPAPVFHQQAPQRQPTPVFQNGGRGNAGHGAGHRQCGGHASDQSCASDGQSQR